MILDPNGRPAEVSMTPREHPLAPRAQEPSHLVEVVRSFSYKLNMGNDENGRPTYESCDLFCSKKEQCSADDVAEVSRGLHAFCVDEVMEGIREIRARRAKKQAARERAA